MLNRHLRWPFNKTPGQGAAPTPQTGKTRHNDGRSPEKSAMSKSEKRNRTELLLGIRCLPEEKALIKEKAELSGMSVGEYLRRCALGRRITPPTDIRMINELLRLGGLQKHLYNQMQSHMTPELSKQFSEVLVALKKAVVAIHTGVHHQEK